MKFRVLMLLGLVSCQARSPVELCHAWCARIVECDPYAVESVEACAVDCDATYANTEVAEVSGFTRDSVLCIVEAATCQEAAQCP